MSALRVLITGFGPFPGAPYNPTKPLVERVWTAVARREAPGNPAHQDVSWGEALAWALVTGALVGVIRLLAQRLAASAWAKATGDYPEALRTTRP